MTNRVMLLPELGIQQILTRSTARPIWNRAGSCIDRDILIFRMTTSLNGMEVIPTYASDGKHPA